MADELAAPYLPEPVLAARPTQVARGQPLFTPRALTLAELLAETEPPAREPRRIQTTRATRSITATMTRVVAVVTRISGARGATADTQTVV